MKRIGIKIFLPINDFLNILILKPLIFMTTKMIGIILFVSDQILIPSFLTGMKKCKEVFQIGFRNGGFFMGATPNIFCPEIKKSFDYFENNSESFFPTGNSYSLFFCTQFRIPWILCWIFVPTILIQAHSLSIWLGNSKSNGGPLSKYPKPKPLSPSKTRLKPKSQKPRSLQCQSPRYQFGPNLYQAQLLGPKLKTHFLQIQHIGPFSKTSKQMQLSHCPSSLTQTQTQMRRTQQTTQPFSSKMKTRASDSLTLPLSNGNVNIFKSL